MILGPDGRLIPKPAPPLTDLGREMEAALRLMQRRLSKALWQTSPRPLLDQHGRPIWEDRP